MMAAKKTTKTAASETPVIENKFSKGQLLAAKRFQGKKDIVNAVLSKYPDTDTFTISSVEEMIEKYMKGKVN